MNFNGDELILIIMGLEKLEKRYLEYLSCEFAKDKKINVDIKETLAQIYCLKKKITKGW